MTAPILEAISADLAGRSLRQVFEDCRSVRRAEARAGVPARSCGIALQSFRDGIRARRDVMHHALRHVGVEERIQEA